MGRGGLWITQYIVKIVNSVNSPQKTMSHIWLKATSQEFDTKLL